MASKIFFLLFAVSCCACTRIGDNRYGFWFDPRGKEYQEQKLHEQTEKERKAEVERQFIAERQRDSELRAQRAKEKKNEDDRLASIAAKQAVIDRQRREVEEKEREEKQKREQEEYLELQRQRDLENQACESYKKKNCQVLTSQACVPVKHCQDAAGKRVCWEEQSCSSNSRTVCGGKKPQGCSTE